MRQNLQIHLPPQLWIPLLMLLITISPKSCSAFLPQSKVHLESAVGACLKLSAEGDCPNGPHGSIGEWDVSNVADMSRMVSYAKSFNGDLSKWDVSSVKDMGSMFLAAKSFNRDLSKWDVSSVSTMSAMFRWAASFNNDISKWDVSSVDSMDYMFWDATLFKRKLCGAAWVHSKAKKTAMFAGSFGYITRDDCDDDQAFSPQSREELKEAVDAQLELIPSGEIKRNKLSNGPNGPIGEWDVSHVTDMSGMFRDAALFNGDISKWDVSRVTDMSHMFHNTKSFNGDISKWDVSRVTDMSHMFSITNTFYRVMLYAPAAFNCNLAKWDVSNVKDMTHMFYGASGFTRDLSKWDVSSVTHMDGMFFKALSFNKKICGATWLNSKASKNSMFEGSSGSLAYKVCATTGVFSPESGERLKIAVDAYLGLCPEGHGSHGPYGPIGEWDVSRVTDMNRLFMNKKSFNGDISKWDVSRVTDMRRMFYNTNLFNRDLSKWDVSSVKDMSYMFCFAPVFNVDLSKWDVSSVNHMDSMFYETLSFKQNICGATWIDSKASKIEMFAGSPGSIPERECTETTHDHVTRRPLPGRELIVRTPTGTPVRASAFTSKILNKMTCPKCGTFGKSGRVSCCAPGGAWYKNCGGAANKNADHRWHEGTETCKPQTTTTISLACSKCGTVGKSGKSSCCGRGGSWFKSCGVTGNARLQHTWYEGIQSCKARTESRIAVGQQANAAQQKGIGSSHGDGNANSKGVIAAAKPSTFSSANMSTPMADTTSIVMIVRRSAIKSLAYANPTTNAKVTAGGTITIISMPDDMPTPSITSASTFVTTQGYDMLMNIVIHIILLVLTVF